MKPQTQASGAVNFKTLQDWLRNHSRVLKQISFGSTMGNNEQDRNIQCSKASGITPGVANTDFVVNHTLGRIPITIAGQDTNNGGFLYRGSAAWTKTTATLRCTTVSAQYNLVLI